MARSSVIERAFELAKSGRYVSIQEIERVLAAEVFQGHQLVGRSLRKQLKELMRASRETGGVKGRLRWRQTTRTDHASP